MATVYSVQKTKWSVNNPSEKVNTNELAGRVRVAYGEYTTASTASGDVIEMFNLPNGARIVGAKLGHEALGGSTTLSVGHAAHTASDGSAVSASAAAYKAAAASTSAQVVDAAATLALGFASVTDANQSGVPVTVTIGGAAATGLVTLTMLYVTD